MAVLARLLEELEFSSVADRFFDVPVPSGHSQNQQNKRMNDNIPDTETETECFDAREDDDALSGCGAASQKLSIRLKNVKRMKHTCIIFLEFNECN